MRESLYAARDTVEEQAQAEPRSKRWGCAGPLAVSGPRVETFSSREIDRPATNKPPLIMHLDSDDGTKSISPLTKSNAQKRLRNAEVAFFSV